MITHLFYNSPVLLGSVFSPVFEMTLNFKAFY